MGPSVWQRQPQGKFSDPKSYSLEAKHLILVWIMRVKGPKNQADFIEVLYVVVNAWSTRF